MTPVVLRSPEGRLRGAVLGCLGLGLLIGAVSSSPGSALLQVVVAVGCFVVAARMWRTRVVADDTGVTDVRLFRTRLLPWTALTGFDVNRPGGLYAGFCVRALDDDTEHDLLGVRAYSRLPVLDAYGELSRIAWTLEDLRQRHVPPRG